MRIKTITKQVKLKKEVHKRCMEDRDNFQKNKEGKLSISDTIEMYQEMVDDLNERQR